MSVFDWFGWPWEPSRDESLSAEKDVAAEMSDNGPTEAELFAAECADSTSAQLARALAPILGGVAVGDSVASSHVALTVALSEPCYMAATDGPVCVCGRPSTTESGLCGQCATPATPDRMIKVAGKPYRCPCGGNVFRYIGEYDRWHRYRCNACGDEIEGTLGMGVAISEIK